MLCGCYPDGFAGSVPDCGRRRRVQTLCRCPSLCLPTVGYGWTSRAAGAARCALSAAAVVTPRVCRRRCPACAERWSERSRECCARRSGTSLLPGVVLLVELGVRAGRCACRSDSDGAPVCLAATLPSSCSDARGECPECWPGCLSTRLCSTRGCRLLKVTGLRPEMGALRASRQVTCAPVGCEQRRSRYQRLAPRLRRSPGCCR